MQRASRERIRTHNQHKRWLALARARGLPIPVLPANLFRKRLRAGGRKTPASGRHACSIPLLGRASIS